MVAGDGSSLMGRDWLGELLPDFSVLNSSPDSSLQNLLRKYADLFKEELGLAKGVTVKLQVDGKLNLGFTNQGQSLMRYHQG